MRRCWSNFVIFIFLIGILIGISGVLLQMFLPDIIDKVIQSRRELSPGSEVYETWKEMPIPVYRTFYIFNYTNAEEYVHGIMENNYVKPAVEEIGPFVFRQYDVKENLTFDDEKDTMSYRLRHYYEFLPEMSYQFLENNITVPNIPGAVVASNAEDVDLMMLDILMNSTNTKLFLSISIGEFLIHGYKDALIDLLQSFSGKTFLKDGKFKVLTNGSNEGLYEINRGRKDKSLYGTIHLWNGKTEVSFWSGKYCNMINGSEGRLYPHNIPKYSKLIAFSSEICRSVTLHYNHEINEDGLTLYQFKPRIDLFADYNINPDNKCFCNSDSECLETGVYSLKTCKKNAPITASMPHFLSASFNYLNSIDGLKPNKPQHESFFEFEPVTGMLLNGRHCLQLNVHIKPRKGLTLYENIREIHMPFIWIRIHATFPNSIRDRVKSMVDLAVTLQTTLPYIIIGIGASITLFSILVAFSLLTHASMTFKFNLFHGKSHVANGIKQ